MSGKVGAVVQKVVVHVHRVWDLVVLRVRRSDDNLRYSNRITLVAVIYGRGEGSRGGGVGGERA